MLILDLDGVEIDRCDQCGGSWLDAGELALIIERGGSQPDRLNEALSRAVETRPTDRRCPRCRRRLREIALGADPEIHVDRCPWGHGLWCDRGEMPAILEGFAAGSTITSFLANLYPAEKVD